MKSAPPPRWLNIGSISSRQKAMVTNASGAGSPASYCDGKHWWYSSGEAGGGGDGGGGVGGGDGGVLGGVDGGVWGGALGGVDGGVLGGVFGGGGVKGGGGGSAGGKKATAQWQKTPPVDVRGPHVAPASACAGSVQ